ncbi:hypothetical protein PIB30_082378, partial [Stylosanthes scabra]|nr:hypothetical protein [Stylosanthes scabra]
EVLDVDCEFVEVLLGRPFIRSAGFKLDYIIDTFSFKVGNVEEIYHPVRPPALNKVDVHQAQLKSEDKVEAKGSEEARRKVEKGKGLRRSPPHTKKKKKEKEA